LFMLVPVGCGLEIAPSEMLPADEYERVLRWFDDQSKTCPIDLKATCAPHYYRIRAQRLEEDRRRGDFTATFIAALSANSVVMRRACGLQVNGTRLRLIVEPTQHALV